MSFEYKIDKVDDVVVIRFLSEHLVLSEHPGSPDPSWRKVVQRVAASAGRVAIDLGCVEFINSGGMGALKILIENVVWSGGAVVLFPDKRRLKRVFLSPSIPPLSWYENESRALAGLASSTYNPSREPPHPRGSVSISVTSSRTDAGLIVIFSMSGEFVGFASVKRAIEFVRMTMDEQDPEAILFHVHEFKGSYPEKKVAAAVAAGVFHGKRRPCAIVGTSVTARMTMGWLAWDVTDPADDFSVRHFRTLREGLGYLEVQLESGSF